MSMNWREMLGRAGEQLRKRQAVRRANGTFGLRQRPLEGGVKAPSRTRKRRPRFRRIEGAIPGTDSDVYNRSRGRVNGPAPGRARRTRASRRTPGGTPAQRAWRQRFGEMSRRGELPKRRRTSTRNRMLRI